MRFYGSASLYRTLVRRVFVHALARSVVVTLFVGVSVFSLPVHAVVEERFEQDVVATDVNVFFQTMVKKIKANKKIDRTRRSQAAADEFVRAGTISTQRLGREKRSAVIKKFTQHCQHAPRFHYSTDWEDVVRLSHARSPSAACTESAKTVASVAPKER